jgi:alkylhydroperoxidase family enzyme
MVERRGLPKQADVDAFRAAGYTDAHVLGIILAIGVKTFSNYANHLMHNEVDEVFAGHALEAAE